MDMDGNVGTAPFQKERPTRRDLTPREKGGKPVTGVYLKTRCGGSHLPVPACRHTVMQSMSACLTLDTLKPGEEVRAPEAVRPTLSK